MKYLIGYATREGQTRRIARHVADRLAMRARLVELLPLDAADELDITRFDAAILAAPVHVNSYPAALSGFIGLHRDWLASHPTLFLSVSLSASGHDAEDWRGLDRIAADLAEATGWTPGKTAQIAGAYRPERYDLFRRLVMRRILALKDPDADPSAAREYTDWPALDHLVEDWAAETGDPA